jgi:hypothetical protein
MRTKAGLLGVILGLLAVGMVSGTMVRHIIQVLPAAVALVLAIRRVSWAYYAALPIFAFWLLIMVAIWLFLLGIARITSGHFTPAEIALTLLIGGACAVGLSQAFAPRPPASRGQRAAWTIVFALLQIAAMWLSLQEPFARI